MRSLCYENQILFILKLDLITITKISHLDSLWERDWGELGNGLFIHKFMWPYFHQWQSSSTLSNKLQHLYSLWGRADARNVSFFNGGNFHGGNSTFIDSFDKTKFLFSSLPPTQHHSFFMETWLIVTSTYDIAYAPNLTQHTKIESSFASVLT